MYINDHRPRTRRALYGYGDDTTILGVDTGVPIPTTTILGVDTGVPIPPSGTTPTASAGQGTLLGMSQQTMILIGVTLGAFVLFSGNGSKKRGR